MVRRDKSCRLLGWTAPMWALGKNEKM